MPTKFPPGGVGELPTLCVAFWDFFLIILAHHSWIPTNPAGLQDGPDEWGILATVGRIADGTKGFRAAPEVLQEVVSFGQSGPVGARTPERQSASLAGGKLVGAGPLRGARQFGLGLGESPKCGPKMHEVAMIDDDGRCREEGEPRQWQWQLAVGSWQWQWQ